MQNTDILFRLQTKTVDLLNRQILMEYHASAQYLTMASWCDVHGYSGSAKFFYSQAEEERQHMLKIFKFLTEADSFTVHPTMDKELVTNFDSLNYIFEFVMKCEQEVTASIHDLIQHCFEVKDFSTYTFLQWYVNEQIEEEAMAKRILDLFSVVKEEGIGLYTIDQAIGNLDR